MDDNKKLSWDDFNAESAQSPELNQKFMDLQDRGEVTVCDSVSEHEGSEDSHDFLIIESWDAHAKVNELFDLDSVEWGFGDEYTRCGCGSCSSALRIQPSSWDWAPPGVFVDYEGYVIKDHLDDDMIEAVVEDKINNAENALSGSFWIAALKKLGFTKMPREFAAGFYHKHDNPSKILEELRKKYPRDEFVFHITSQAQFETGFTVYARGELSKVNMRDEITKAFDMLTTDSCFDYNSFSRATGILTREDLAALGLEPDNMMGPTPLFEVERRDELEAFCRKNNYHLITVLSGDNGLEENILEAVSNEVFGSSDEDLMECVKEESPFSITWYTNQALSVNAFAYVVAQGDRDESLELFELSFDIDE
jgi:hypothetical protein